MMKLHGKTYYHSILKLLIDDKIVDMLKDLTAFYKTESNNHTIAALIIDKFNQTQQWIKENDEKLNTK